MGVNPSDFKAHSDRVECDYNDEIARRNAISRKYYYIFHLIREQNRNHNSAHFSFGNGGNDHKEASNFIKRVANKDLADDFDDLRSKRNEADYDINDDIPEIDYQTFKYDLQEFIRNSKQERVIIG